MGVALAMLCGPARAGNVYDFSFTAIDGTPMPMSRFAGKAILLVNTASFCGFTPQYKGLQALWERYRDDGLVVIGVPSNDFGSQEPGTEDEIKDFCEATYRIDFPLTEKQHVVGRDAHPLYRWVVEELGPGSAPIWNFHKFLIDPDGNPVQWFETTARPGAAHVIDAIVSVLPAEPTHEVSEATTE
jgi:glutathione peroxidase